MPDLSFAFLATTEGWAAMVTLIAMEVVLGIDNLIFISILTNKLPAEHRQKARRLGIGAALVMRLVLLTTIAWIVGMTAPLFTAFGHGFSLARPHPDRWRTVPDLEGDEGDPPHRRSRGPQGRDRQPCGQRLPRRRDLSDLVARPGLLGQLDHHRRRDDRASRDHVHRGNICDHSHACRRHSACRLHRAQPDDCDARPRLSADDRHDADC